SEIAEHKSVRGAAGLFDLSHMGEIAVTGPGAADALDYALTGHLSALKPGRARYTMICAPDGGVLDDLIVYRLADNEVLVVGHAAHHRGRGAGPAGARGGPPGLGRGPDRRLRADRHPGPPREPHPPAAHRYRARPGALLLRSAGRGRRPRDPARPHRIYRGGRF